MKIFDQIEQGSEEWIRIRKGKPTASRFSEIVTAKTGELSKSAGGYINELIGELFCPEFEYWTGNQFTERGKQFEQDAREAFEAESGFKLKQVGFCLSDDGISGCSPDALIYDGDKLVSGLELKCPTPKVHVGYVLGGVLPSDYVQQVHGSINVTNLDRWEFFSYFPGMRYLWVTVHRDGYTAKVKTAVDQFVIDYRKAREIAIPKLQIKL